MNCVYDAFGEHMIQLGEYRYQKVYEEYLMRKHATHKDIGEYTFAGVVPYLYWYMLIVHNSLSVNTIEMRIERHYVPLLELFDEASDTQKTVMHHNTKYFGHQVDKITIEPAIYCLLNEQHAVYAEEIPDYPGARILMAIRLEKKNE